MVALMNRSIDLLEEIARATDNASGSIAAATSTRPPTRRAPRLCATAAGRRAGRRTAARHARRGGTPAPRPQTATRTCRPAPIFVDRALIRRHFPYLPKTRRALLHARRCGWFSGQQLGMYLLERAATRA